jgi:hypothetical protein
VLSFKRCSQSSFNIFIETPVEGKDRKATKLSPTTTEMQRFSRTALPQLPLLPQMLQKMPQMTVLQARAIDYQVHALFQFLLQELPVSLWPPPPPPLSASTLRNHRLGHTHS